jgi:transcriptional regulator with XRE-family HTH domain
MTKPKKPKAAALIALKPQVLTSWRERMGMSQRDAARALGCSRGAWAGWEAGDKDIPPYIGLAIAALALGVTPYGQTVARKPRAA